MAVVYRAPEHLGDPPDFEEFKDESGRYDFQAHAEAEEAWIQTVQAEAKRVNPKCDIAGEVIRFPMGDGYAVYVVWSTNKPAIIWCPVGDNWSLPEAHARGLRASDLRDEVASRKALEELFGGSKKKTANE